MAIRTAAAVPAEGAFGHMTSNRTSDPQMNDGREGITLTDGFRLVLARLGADHPALLAGAHRQAWLDPEHD